MLSWTGAVTAVLGLQCRRRLRDKKSVLVDIVAPTILVVALVGLYGLFTVCDSGFLCIIHSIFMDIQMLGQV